MRQNAVSTQLLCYRRKGVLWILQTQSTQGKLGWASVRLGKRIQERQRRALGLRFWGVSIL